MDIYSLQLPAVSGKGSHFSGEFTGYLSVSEHGLSWHWHFQTDCRGSGMEMTSQQMILG